MSMSAQCAISLLEKSETVKMHPAFAQAGFKIREKYNRVRRELSAATFTGIKSYIVGTTITSCGHQRGMLAPGVKNNRE